jgi:hypothetical protein
MSIPFICRTATAQDAAASPSVAVSAAAVAAVLALVVANHLTVPSSETDWPSYDCGLERTAVGVRFAAKLKAGDKTGV